MGVSHPEKSAGLECHAWAGFLAHHYHQGRPLHLLFDFDGTLAPHVSHPALARVPRKTGRLLADLAAIPRITLGILSGRPLVELKCLVDFPVSVLAGSGGRHLILDGKECRDPHMETDRPVLAELKGLLDLLCGEYPGCWLEAKPGCLALHYRGLARKDQSELLQRAKPIIGSFPCEWVTREVGLALEISTKRAWDKRKAYRLALGLGPKTTLPFYAGDGANDEPAMNMVNELDGATVGVGCGSPEIARYFEPTPQTLAWGLENLVGLLEFGPGYCQAG